MGVADRLWEVEANGIEHGPVPASSANALYEYFRDGRQGGDGEEAPRPRLRRRVIAPTARARWTRTAKARPTATTTCVTTVRAVGWRRGELDDFGARSTRPWPYWSRRLPRDQIHCWSRVVADGVCDDRELDQANVRQRRRRGRRRQDGGGGERGAVERRLGVLDQPTAETVARDRPPSVRTDPVGRWRPVSVPTLARPFV